MIACLDVAYYSATAVAACVLFEDWPDSSAAVELTQAHPAPAPYRSGMLFKRELPPLLAVLKAAPAAPTLLIIDGYVWLDSNLKPGLGGHLFAALGADTPVIGVAKRPFAGAPALPILRGRSKLPLFVTAAGVPLQWAATRIIEMHGPFRLPTLIKRADQLSRSHRVA